MSHEGVAPTGQEPVADRREALASAFEQFENPTPDAAPVEPAAPAAPGEDKPGRARDEGGRFVAKDPAPAAPAAPVAPVEPQPWSTAPKSWKKELAEGWGKLDPAYQQYVHEREAQMRSGIEPLLPKAQLADQISQAAAPYMQTIRGLGIDLPRAVAGLMEVDHNLRTLPYEQKLQLLAQTALSYGIDLSGQMQYAQQYGNPMQNELLQLKGQFNNFLQAQEQQLQHDAADTIQRFSQTAEHFEEVRPLMAKLLQSGMATTIEEAYDRAIRLTPELFDKVQSARQASADAEKRKAADAAAKAAKAAAVSPKSATPGISKPADAQDRRSVLREQLDALSERL